MRKRRATRLQTSTALYFLLSGQLLATGIPSVKETAGNIFLVQADGKVKQLTDSGEDSVPSISADNRNVVFVRSHAGSQSDDLFLLDLSRTSGNSVKIVTPVDLMRTMNIHHISDPQFSPDSSSVYFFSQPGNLGVIIRIRVVTREASVIAHSVLPMKRKSFDLIGEGKYRGDLVVYQDSEKLTAGRLFLYWLLSPEGGRISIIADNESDVELFLAENR